MSGSSLDGLDMALLQFGYDRERNQLLHWELLAAETRAFDQPLRKRLAGAHELPSAELMRLHTALGRQFGVWAAAFLQERNLQADWIASHGHTVFHEPAGDPPFTLQIGDGAALAAAGGVPVICDFRSADIAAGGSGAPMAPLADTLLFPEYDAWLNIGGIANLTWRMPGMGLYARDITGANQILNALAAEAGRDMDTDGRLAAKGVVIGALLEEALATAPSPDIKALSNQWVRELQVALFCRWPGRVEDRLATMTACIAVLIARALKADPPTVSSSRRMLLSGGGACNMHLTGCLRHALMPLGWQPETAGEHITHFKEAALMALAGLLRWYGHPNFLPAVTGARRAVSGGAIYLP